MKQRELLNKACAAFGWKVAGESIAPASAVIAPRWLRDTHQTCTARPVLHTALKTMKRGQGEAFVAVRLGENWFALEDPGLAVLAGRRDQVAAVHLLVRGDDEGKLLQLAQAEIRCEGGRPQACKTGLWQAAIGLIEQGALHRSGSAIAAPSVRSSSAAQRLHAGMATGLIIARRVAGNRLDRSRRGKKDQWAIGCLKVDDFPIAADPDWERIVWSQPPQDGFVADPIVVDDGQQKWLFYEQLHYRDWTGYLKVAPLPADGGEIDWPKARTVLKQPHHLSYPAVIRDTDNHWWMTPEESASGQTTLYRAIAFPYEWQAEKVILEDFPGVDPTLHRDENGWWLFITHGSAGCKENNLFLFFARFVRGPYTMVGDGPIRAGLFGSRMAGPLVVRNRRTYRFGQDARRGYGGGIATFEVTRLDTHGYAESFVSLWEPSVNKRLAQGLHTASGANGMVVFDAMRFASPASPL